MYFLMIHNIIIFATQTTLYTQELHKLLFVTIIKAISTMNIKVNVSTVSI